MKSGWQSSVFCVDYLKNVIISTNDVHYGYLAPGERELGLLGSRKALVGKKVLEIGCGAAQNCIALSKWGAVCVGVDISQEMLSQARVLAQRERVSVNLMLGDARELLSIIGDSGFDIFLSSYAIGFICRNLKDLGSLISQIKELSNPGAKLVFCLRHPCQMDGVAVDERSEWLEACFDINEVVSLLLNRGFKRVSTLGQKTINPSRLTEEEKERFPYVTMATDARFDELSHKPHTIIYSAQV